MIKTFIKINDETLCVARYQAYSNTLLALDSGDYYQDIITVNVESLPENFIAIPEYKLGDEITKDLIKANVIEKDQIAEFESGFVTIPVYKITDESFEIIKKALDDFDEQVK